MTVRTSTFFENALLNVLRNSSYAVTTLYGSLHTADPGQTGASEATGAGYARVVISLAAASGGSAASSTSVLWTIPSAMTISHFGLWDALTGGNYLIGSPLTSPVVFAAAGFLTILSGQITVASNTL